MKHAVELAKKGEGFTNPNPLVGAVFVKDGKIIGEGYHKCYGQLHAERDALKNATESTEGADIYVTLEPCSHHGKQPPCCEALVEAGIKTVYVGSDDPNPLVSGNGYKYLEDNGVKVIRGILKDECDKLNEIFFHYITNKRPYVIMKAAMSIDGRTASYTGDSKWISNELSRENVHRTRKRVAAIMVGINTVINDNPILNCRCENPSHPIRIVCDSNLRIPLDCQLVKTAHQIPLIVATACRNDEKKTELEKRGVEVIETNGQRVNLKELMNMLGEKKIDSLLLEGGSEMHASMLEAGLVDKLQIYIAPKIIGGRNAKPTVGGKGVELVKNADMFTEPQITMFGDDILIEYVRKKER